MFQFGIRAKRLILVLGDVAIFQAGLIITLWLRYGHFDRTLWNAHAFPFGIITLLWTTGLYVAGLYDLGILKNGVKFFRLFLEGMIANLAVAFAFFYLIPIFGIEPRTNLFLYFAITLLFGYIWRICYNRFIASALFKNRICYIGTAADASKISKLLEHNSYGFVLAAIIETAGGDRFEIPDVKWYSSLDSLGEIIASERIHTILLGHRPDDVPGLREALYKTLFTPVDLLDRTALEETMTGRVPVDYVSQTWFLEHLRENEKTWYEGAKRAADILLAIPFGALTILLYPFVALAIKANSPGPILIRQQRVGRGGTPFQITKFRSMVEDAEAAGTPQYASEGDPRVTKVGRVIRATRIDELPQIWNVFTGEMSLIGPRPERPQFVEELTRQMPYYALRHLTRPGLTGWAQVKFPYAGTFEDNLKKVQYDLYYIKNRSLLLDIAILLKTIGIVLRRQGT